MFGSKKTNVIYIKKETLRAGTVVLGKNPKVENVQDYNWKKENLATVISQIIKNYKTDTFRLLLDESVCFVVYNSLLEEKFEKDKIKEKIEETIKQKVDKTIWGFKYVQIAKDVSKGIQSVIISPSFLEETIPGLSQTRMKIETIEPVSISLTRLCEQEDFPYIIIHSSQPTTVISAIKDVVLTSNNFEEKLKINDLKEIYNHTKENYIAPGKIIASSFPDMLNINDLKIDSPVNIENKELNPMIGIALKKPHRVEEDIILNIALFGKMIRAKDPKDNKRDNKQIKEEQKDLPKEETTPIESQIIAETTKRENKFLTFLIIIFIIAIIGGLGFFAFSKTTLNNKITQFSIPLLTKPTPIPTNTPTPIPTPIPTENLDKKDLKIKILNGSGTSGLASKVANSLKDLGYEEPTTGNADSYEYETTIIEAKESRKDYVELLKKDLLDYSTEPDTKLTLDKESDFDILITLGKE